MDAKVRHHVPVLLWFGLVSLAFSIGLSIYGTPSLFGIARITGMRAALLLLCIGLPLYSNSLWFVISQRVCVILGGFLLMRLVSLMISPMRNLGTPQVLWFAEGFLLFVLLSSACHTFPAIQRFFARLVVLAAGFAALIITYQYFQLNLAGSVKELPFSTSAIGTDPEIFQGWYPTGVDSRIIGTFQDPNLAGSVMSLWLTLMLFYYSHISRARRGLAVVVIVIGLIALFATGSRQAALSTLVGFAFFVSSRTRGNELRTLAVAIVFSIIGAYYFFTQVEKVLNAGSMDDGSGTVVQRQARAISDPKQELTGGRIDHIHDLISELDYNVLLLGKGEGAGSWSAHNGWLIVLEEDGIWALLLLVLGVGWFFIDAIRSAANCKQKRGTAEYILSSRHSPELLAVAEAGPGLIAVWLFLVTVNWAQLNQNICWIFLTLIFANRISNSSLNFTHRLQKPRSFQSL